MIGGALIILAYLVWVLFEWTGERNTRFNHHTQASASPEIEETDIIYDGATNEIGLSEIEIILNKHFQYYSWLDAGLKTEFLNRVQKFMNKKIFIIKSNEGFREMPVLVSASAVQLTFGLQNYLLPFYRYIRIYPKEYLGDGPFKLLAGNVHRNMITVAWNHFLKGNQDAGDGANLGLHEMSHALYFQKMVIDGDTYAKDFCNGYDDLLTACKEAHHLELTDHKNVYSDYAETDLQEFWAESTELFFEKPTQLTEQYPLVYEAMKKLLKQDPLNQSFPVIHENLSLSRRLFKFFSRGRV